MLPTAIDLFELNGNNGFILRSNNYDDAGYSVSGVGDVNGDGFDDVIIGAPGADFEAGKSYVVFGGNSFAPSLELNSLDGNNGFVLNGINGLDDSGKSVSGAGDINGDGFDDIIIGAPFADPKGRIGAGESYVVFGGNSFAPSLELNSLDGNNGFVLNGIDENDTSGLSVSRTGDVNGDGFADIIISAQGGDPNGNSDAGESYVVFGRNSFAPSLELNSLDGSNGFVLNGIDPNDLSGTSVSGAGDVNGDGFDDIIIGAQSGDPNGNMSAGESYVVFGGNSFAPSLELNALNGSNGFILNGLEVQDFSGLSVSSAGDVNGDGFADIIIGAPSADPDIEPNGGPLRLRGGESYVVFGRNSFAPVLELDNLDGSNGFVLNGIDQYDNSGRSVSGAGDINGDGFDDIIIGAPDADPNGNTRAGESYVVFGGNSFAASLELNTLNGNNGFALNGINIQDFAGYSVSSAGDVNNDGFDDVIIGSFGSQESYILFGVESFEQIPRLIQGTSGRDTISGSANPETINALAGNDSVTGLAGNDTINGDMGQDSLFGNNGDDVITGGDGNDLLWGQAGDDSVEGNQGKDNIQGNNGNDTLLGGNAMDSLFGGAGDDRLLGGEDNDLIWGQADRDTLFGDAGADTLYGNNGNDVLAGGNGEDSLLGNAGDDDLAGDRGNDILFGNNDNDTLYGGEGNDTLWGGAGNDTFELTRGENVGVDRVKDYVDGSDKFLLSNRFGVGNLEFSDLTITQSGSNTQIKIAENNQILAVVEGVDANQIDSNDFIS